MAQRRSGRREPTPEEEPAPRASRADAARRTEEGIELGRQLLDRQISRHKAMAGLASDFRSWHDDNETLLLGPPATSALRDRQRPVAFSAWSPDPMSRLHGARRDIDHQQSNLESIPGQLDPLDDIGASTPRGAVGVDPAGGSTFVVHGHDEAGFATVVPTGETEVDRSKALGP